MSIKEKIKQIEDDLNLSKKFPNYFNKNIFRTATIILFLLFAIGFVTNDYQLSSVYATCDSETPCQNPFYLCDNIRLNQSEYFIGTGHQCLPSITWATKKLCEQGGCDKKTLQPHETIGNPPNFFNKHFPLWIIILYTITFATNHALYKKKQNEDKNKKLN